MTSAPTFSPAALRQARRRAGLTQLEVAQRCAARGQAVTQPLMSHWETGRQAPSVSNLPALAAVLDCTVDDLFETRTTAPKRATSKAVA